MEKDWSMTLKSDKGSLIRDKWTLMWDQLKYWLNVDFMFKQEFQGKNPVYHWNMVFQNISGFYIFLHHGGVANFCRLLLRGCFSYFIQNSQTFTPCFFSVVKIDTITISPVWLRTTQQKNEPKWTMNWMAFVWPVDHSAIVAGLLM